MFTSGQSMSTPLTTRLFAAGVVALFAHQVRAQEEQPYEAVYRAWLEAGGLFSQSTDLSGFPGAGGASKLELHPGVRVGLGSSYGLTHYFSVDWEVAVLASSVRKASGLDEMDAVITQVPFLISGTFQYQNQTGFTPFVGVGVGAASTAINVDEARSGSTTLEGSDYDFVFAWQVAGGVRYEVNKRLGLGVLYKYLWTGDAKWELEDNGVSTSGNQKLEIDGIRSHAILAFVSYRF